MNRRVRCFLLIFSLCAAWTIISWAPIYKYLTHGKATAAMLLGILFISLGMHWLARFNQQRRQISVGWFLLLFLILVAAFATLYPLSLKHTLNRGSDREDALRIELNAVHHHRYPYDAHTFLGNPPTPLPGAMLLTAPFFVLGHIAWQNFLWLALFFIFTIRFFSHRATALFYLVVFLLLAPANLSDFTSGGDYLTNFYSSFDRLIADFMFAFLPRSFWELLSLHVSSMRLFLFHCWRLRCNVLRVLEPLHCLSSFLSRAPPSHSQSSRRTPSRISYSS